MAVHRSLENWSSPENEKGQFITYKIMLITNLHKKAINALKYIYE